MTYSIKTLGLSLALAIGLLITSIGDTSAQTLRRGKAIGQSGIGTDVWTTTMAGLGLFRAHRNDCNATTEAFVKIYTNPNSVDFGICIDKDEHSAGSKEFEDARQECLDDGKRLPEPAEFKYTCDQAGTLNLNNMTDDWEWTTNFTILGSSSGYGPAATTGGNGSCKHGSWEFVARHTGTSASKVFRCVR
ncbi:MAG: hypothetical protein GKS03_17075 [Alphaproteobacteria bacterium]|nr:hypothetical protein [Alphaproteobacteria bacterium]